jgi:hypothetical protein
VPRQRDARAIIDVLYCFPYNHAQDARATFGELSNNDKCLMSSKSFPSAVSASSG